MPESFPCIICGQSLERVFEEEGQPDDGVMCKTSGNYGSTVYDPHDMRYLAFNICDPCLVRAGEQGRVMETRDYQPVVVDGFGLVGRQRVERPYVSWHRGLPSDDAQVLLDVEDLDKLPASFELLLTPEEIRKGIGLLAAERAARRAAREGSDG